MKELTPDFLTSLMREALVQANAGKASKEVPVGAVIAHSDKIIASAHNQVESDKDASAHAETLAIGRAGAEIGNWRLSDCILCVTLEPCPMCAGAIRLARIPAVVYGASDERLGAFGSRYDLSLDDAFGEKPRVISCICEDECAEILKDFFASRRK